MATLTPTSEDTRIYEIAILYGHPISQKEEQELLKAVEKLLDEAGANQIAKDTWGQRGLAYRIGGHYEGMYVVYHYEMDPSKLKEVEQQLRITPGVLRHLIVKPPKGYEVVKYSEKYEQWLKDREHEEVVKKEEKEEALKRKVVEKAKRQVKKAEKKEEKEVEAAPAPKIEEGKLSEELEKLISDEDLDI